MTAREMLVAANVQKASLVLVASGDDARNLEAALRVLRLNPEAELWVRLYRIGLSDMMDTATLGDKSWRIGTLPGLRTSYPPQSPDAARKRLPGPLLL